MSGPPTVGKTLSVRVDKPLHDDLDLLMRTGMTASDVVRAAVALAAKAAYDAWSSGTAAVDTWPGSATAAASTYDSRHTSEGT